MYVERQYELENNHDYDSLKEHEVSLNRLEHIKNMFLLFYMLVYQCKQYALKNRSGFATSKL